MNAPDSITFQFISEPSDVNYGGKVHGGEVMKWIDQTAYACARNWAESYCVTVYVSGIQFHKPINIGDLIKIDAKVIHTGTTSIHISVDVQSRRFEGGEYEKKTDCVIVFVSVDENGRPQNVRKWLPRTEEEKKLEQYAKTLKSLQDKVREETETILQNHSE
jgi:acyl-CoA hydrolase